MFRMNSSGIALLKATIASNPVQWAGATKSGPISFMSGYAADYDDFHVFSLD